MPWVSQQMVFDECDRAWLEKLGLASVDRVLAYRPRLMVAISTSSDVFRLELEHDIAAPMQIYIKRYYHHTLGAKLKAAFRGGLFAASRARWEYEFLTEMRRRGVPAVRPIGWGEQRNAGLLQACFLITEGATACEPVEAHLQHLPRKTDLLADRCCRLIESMARFVCRMHRAGVMHGGLFGRNILIHHGGGQGTPAFLLIDPDRRGRLYDGEIPWRAVVSDLSDLASTLAPFFGEGDIKRLATAYCGASCTKISRDGLFRALTAETRRKQKKELHRLAVGSALGWLRRRVANSTAMGRDDQPALFDSIPAFFKGLSRAVQRSEISGPKTRTIHFLFGEANGKSSPDQYTLTLEEGRFLCRSGLLGRPDLTVETDSETWLAIANGRSDTFDLLRERRLMIKGDTTLLALLAKSLEGHSAESLEDSASNHDPSTLRF